MNSLKRAMIVLAFAAALAATGKTVALWPINCYDGAGTALDLRCRVNPENDLSATTLGAPCPGLPWTWPDKPDETLPLDFTRNANAISNAMALAKMPVLWSASAGRHLVRTNDFTVEGWVRFLSVPTSSGFFYVLGAMEGSGNSHRWFLSFRLLNSRLAWVFATLQMGDRVAYLEDCGEDAASITDGWRHLAVSHDADDGQGNEVWNVYLDGTCILTATESIPSFAGNPTNSRLDLGGRTTNSNSTPALFDYWRISDTVLTPGQFLCQAGEGTSPAASSTVAYWKLDRKADGTINAKPSVGSLEMNGFFRTADTMLRTELGMDSDAAFEGLPPNMAMSPTPVRQTPNSGSLQSFATGRTNCLVAAGLGTYLTLTNDFTVEGWLKPVRPKQYSMADDAFFVQFIALTRSLDAKSLGGNDESGWQFGFRYQASTGWRLFCFAHDGTRRCLPDAALSDVVSDWHTWRHVALSYTAGDGNGTWRCYLDGVQSGQAENMARPSSGGVYGTQLSLGGRPSATDRSLEGKLDYVRISGAALQPSQLLVSEGGTAATNVLALWPLNTSDGAYFDGRDSMGAYDLTADPDAKYRARPFAEAPVISNPDTSAAFAGDAATVNGSVLFRDEDAGERAALGTLDPGALNLVNARLPMTIECFVRRNGTAAGNWEHVVVCQNALSPTAYGSLWFGLCHKAGTGFYIVDKFWSNNADQTFSGTAGIADDGDWHHVALTREFDDATVTYGLFIDGVGRGSIQRPTTLSRKGSFIIVGGRPGSQNSFRGAISSLRFSNRALDPREFLNAQGTVRANAAYALWPLDSASGSLNVSSLTNAFFGFQTVLSATGSPDMAVFSASAGGDSGEGTTVGNRGSVVLSGGELSVRNLGAWMPPADSGTTEGWLKWDGGDGTVAAIQNGECGWRLHFEGGALRLDGRASALGTPYVSGTLLADASSLRGTWAHLALVHDRSAGLGTWRLHVNRTPVGSLENLWAPSADANGRLPDFRLGGVSEGTFDLWRVSRGALAPQEFLSSAAGLTIMLR